MAAGLRPKLSSLSKLVSRCLSPSTNEFQGRRLLDVGGVSVHADNIKRIFVGADVCTLNIDRIVLGSDSESILGNALCMPFRPESWDILVSFDLIEHLANPDDFLDEAHRVLVDEGIFIVSTPNLADIGSRMVLLFGGVPFSYDPSKYRVAVPLSPVRGRLGGRDHKSVFTLKALRELLEIHGFHVVGSSGFSYAVELGLQHVSGHEARSIGFRRARLLGNRALPKGMREGLIVVCKKKEKGLVPVPKPAN